MSRKGERLAKGGVCTVYAGGGDVEDKALVELGNLLPRDVRINVRSTTPSYIMLRACSVPEASLLGLEGTETTHTLPDNKSTPKQHPSTRTTV